MNGALPLETKMNLSEENVFTENVLNPGFEDFQGQNVGSES